MRNPRHTHRHKSKKQNDQHNEVRETRPSVPRLLSKPSLCLQKNRSHAVRADQGRSLTEGKSTLPVKRDRVTRGQTSVPEDVLTPVQMLCYSLKSLVNKPIGEMKHGRHKRLQHSRDRETA